MLVCYSSVHILCHRVYTQTHYRRIIHNIHTYIHIHTHTYIHIHTHIYTYTHTHNIYTYTYIHTYIHTHIHTCHYAWLPGSPSTHYCSPECLYPATPSILHEPDVVAVVDISHDINLGKERRELLDGHYVRSVHHVLLFLITLMDGSVPQDDDTVC